MPIEGLRPRSGEVRPGPGGPAGGGCPQPVSAMPVTPSAGHPWPGSHDRRAAPRRPGQRQRVFVTDAQGAMTPFLAALVDYSEGGLRLSSAMPVAAGTFLNVRPNDTSSFGRWLRIEVVYCVTEGSRWILGCQFVDVPSSRELVLFAS